MSTPQDHASALTGGPFPGVPGDLDPIGGDAAYTEALTETADTDEYDENEQQEEEE